MPGYFFDTSALVKRYRPEQGSDAVDGIFAASDATVVISRLGIVEASSALAMRVRVGELTIADYAIARKRLFADVSQGVLKVVSLLVGHYQSAERLVERHAPTRRLRTLDALQLAVAIDLHRQARIAVFACADATLCEIATFEGVPIMNPPDAN